MHLVYGVRLSADNVYLYEKKSRNGEKREGLTPLLISPSLIKMQTFIIVCCDATGIQLISASCLAHMAKVITAH